MAPPDMASVRRLAIVKLSAIGDLVHALPVAAALGDAYPHLEISWIVEPMSAPIVTGNPYLHEVIVLPAHWRINRFSVRSAAHFRQLRRELAARRFDVALDLQGLSKSALVAWATGARHRYGYDYIREIAPLLERRVPRSPDSIHIVDQLLDVARFLGAPAAEVKFPLHVPPDADESAAALLAATGIDPAQPFIAVNPTAGGGGYKSWGPDRIGELITRLAASGAPPVVLVGSAGDIEVAEQIRSIVDDKRRTMNDERLLAQSNHEAPVDNGAPPELSMPDNQHETPNPAQRTPSLVAQTDLKQLIAVLRRARLHVCGDTGSAHLAAAVGTRTVSIFGRTDPAKLAPHGQERWVVQHRECCAEICRRYHATAPINRPQKCLAPPPACMAAVSVDEVFDTVMRALSEP